MLKRTSKATNIRDLRICSNGLLSSTTRYHDNNILPINLGSCFTGTRRKLSEGRDFKIFNKNVNKKKGELINQKNVLSKDEFDKKYLLLEKEIKKLNDLSLIHI